MKSVKVEDAIGLVLGHDITEIVPGEFKGVAFKKGHIIKEEDIERFLRIGKEHIYVFDFDDTQVHEYDAALRMGKLLCGPGVYYTDPVEGKTNIMPKHKGLLKINRELVDEINEVGEMILATIQGDRYIDEGHLIGGYRVTPLLIDKDLLEKAEEILKEKGPIFEIKPFNKLKVGLIVTGSEVYKGRIEDKFGPVIVRKLKKFDSEVVSKVIVPDVLEDIRDAILDAKNKGAEMILVTGGMSVDPDDKTPGAIKATGAQVVTYGTPVLPGSMLMLAYLDGVPLMGLPGCVMFNHTTAFDLLLPRICGGETIVKKDITRMGYGGQCLMCQVCTFPDCSFGKH